MALLTKAEFGSRVGLTTKLLAVYIGRKKVFVTEGGLIDDADPVNQLFIAKRQLKGSKKEESGGKAAPKAEKQADPKDREDKNILTDILKDKGSLDVRKKKGELTLQEIEIRKKLGELVPTDAVRHLVITHSESIKNAYNEATDNLIVILSQKKEMSSTEVADIRGQMTKIINNAIDSAINVSKRKISDVVREYSEKRGVGQHD
jgi:hypothetical protein